MSKALFGVAFRPAKTKRIKVEYHATDFGRNISAAALKRLGFKVRKIKRKVV